MNRIAKLLPILSLFVAGTVTAFAALPQTMNYQGYLKDGAGAPVNGATSITFSLYSSSPARSNPVWRESRSVTPTNGIYSVQLGSVTPITAPFDVPYWLGVKVASDPEMALQPLSSTGYAFRAGVAESVASSGGSSATITAGGQTMLRIDPNATSPNFTLGNPVNIAGGTGVVGATVSGGGSNTNSCWDTVSRTYNKSCSNTASASYSTIGGGMGNTVSGGNSTVGGGTSNTASGGDGTVGGGAGNTSSGLDSTVGGGTYNTASDQYSTVGGGANNAASGANSTVGGGYGNIASGINSTAGGGTNNSASGTDSTVSGFFNTASGYAASVGGGV